ncbi:MAG: hypothetical protein ABIH82_01985 [Candidatus Woesearchaeota archaeon]
MIIVVLMFFLLIISVSAAVQITESEIKFDVSYESLDEDTDTTTGDFSFEVTGEVSASYTIEIQNLPSGYDFTPKSFTLESATETKTINFNTIPHLQDGGETQIGTLVVKASDNSQDTAKVIQNTKSMLIIRDGEIKYINDDEKSKKGPLDEDEIIDLDNVLIGTEMSISFNLENLFDKNYKNGDITNIELDLEADSRNFFYDEPDTFELDDIDRDKDLDFTYTFLIDPEADEGDVTLTFTIQAEDDENAQYEIIREINFELIRKEDDVRITKMELVPEKVTSCADKFSLKVEMENFGSDDQKEAVFTVYNEKLNINENIADIKLDEFSGDDNNWENTFSFDLNDVIGGTYYLDLRAFINNDDNMDTEMVKVEINPCEDDDIVVDDDSADDQQDTNTATDDNIVTAGTDDQTTDDDSTVSSSSVIKSTEESYSEEDLLVGGVIVVVILLLAMICLFIAIIIKK